MAPSHHRPEGGFQNPWPGTSQHRFRDFLRWRRERRARRIVNAALASWPVSAGTFEVPHAEPDLLTATWIGHATVLLQLGTLNVLTDPIWSRRASPVSWIGPARMVAPPVSLSALPPIDLVLISHNHYDHLDRTTVHELAELHPAARWFAPLGVASLLRRWGVRAVQELDWWDTAPSGMAQVSCVPARHFSGRGLRDRNRTLWSGWTIAADGWRVFFAGDTGHHPEFTQIAGRHGPFDLVLLPVGAYDPRWFMASVHMDPADALDAYAALRAVHAGAPAPSLLPIHWGTFRLTDEPVHEPGERTRLLWNEAGLSAGALWLGAHGTTWRRGRTG